MQKNGYIVFDFVDSNPQVNQSGPSKKTFVMTLLNVRKFLDIDPDYKMKVYRRPGVIEENADDEDSDGDEVCLNF